MQFVHAFLACQLFPYFSLTVAWQDIFLNCLGFLEIDKSWVFEE